MKIIYLIIILLTTACNSSKQELKQIVSQWQQKEIIFPKEIEKQIYKNNISDSNQYKILNYIDTNGCSMCRLKLYEWKLLKKEIDSLQLNVSIIFIAHLKNYNNLIKMQKLNKFNIPIIQDSIDIMNQINHFPSIPLFQTFLSDHNNKVLLIGNPIHHTHLWNLYKEQILYHQNI